MRRPLLAATLIALGACRGRRDAAPAVAPAGPDLVVKRGAIEDRLVLTGELEAITAENLVVPRTPSWLLAVRWLADDGAVVKKGDPVVEFDSSSFSSTLDDKRLAVVRAQNELASELARAAGALADKGMEVDRKRAELDKAAAEAGVSPDLYPRRLFQEKQMAKAQKQDALAKAEEDFAAEQRAARLERSVKSIALARTERELSDLNDRLAELTLRAPRDGLVQIAVNRREGRKFLVGDQSFPGWAVASMPDLTAMQVRARLSDVDDGGVREGMHADCILDAYPERIWKGTVTQVSPVARSEGREATRRFFDVTIKLDAASPTLMRPGMSMRVEVVRRRAEGVLIVPRVALRGRFPGKAEVTLTGGQVTPVEVQWCTELSCVLGGGVLEGALLEPHDKETRGTS
jgi:multidrug efflux pump subunit AcrA (membrane-fusion protein)